MKQHYILLDDLRGIAALMVLGYHLFEAVAFANGDAEQKMFNGFMGVDFFFILSGFVMGYAYKAPNPNPSPIMGKGVDVTYSNWALIKRRLIRLHPMVLMGVLIGVIFFVIQGCTKWDGTVVSPTSIMWSALLALFLIPSPLSMDVRGNTEAFPLDGPLWSLFFEYIGSLVFILALRKMKTKWLILWTALSFCALVWIAFCGPTPNSIGNGWSSEPFNLLGGAIRLSFAYPLGLLLQRLSTRPLREGWGGAFPTLAIILIATLSVPSMSSIASWLNPLYQLFCVAVIFPAIVLLAANNSNHSLAHRQSRRGKGLGVGAFSYPLYTVHYPLIYLYIDMINKHTATAWTPVWIAMAAITLAIITTKYYDEPVRRKLNKIFR